MPYPLRLNPIWNTDSYKLSHWKQYPADTFRVYSHLMARGGFWKHTLMTGLQGILEANFTGKVFTCDDVREAEELSFQHFGTNEVFNTKGWLRLLEKHGGRLPLKIRAPREGTLIPVKNVLMTIENTDDEFPWLTNWAETILLQVWYPITVGTLSFEIRQAIGKDLVRTGTPELIDFKLHDFGFRGVSSKESAAIGGASHLFNFHGTDTLAAIQYLRQYYGAAMPGYSIPAMEHSTVTSWGKEHEEDSYRNMLRSYPKGLAACVIDSYDTHNAVDVIFGDHLREEILRRNGTVVLRPDSGDPTVVLEDLFNSVADRFGFETNSKGWKVLPAQVRSIQGDGVNYQNILRINSHLIRNGWSMDNWGYGMGGALLQQQNRDTMRMAIKCSAINRDGTWSVVFKDPKTDTSKASIGGRLNLVDRGNGNFVTVASDNENEWGNVLETVFENGVLKIEETYDEIWARCRKADRYVEEAKEAYA
jgi:nicotinamide phosphoribosyltransferase